jgi:CHAT domain-containing protein
MLLPPEVVEDTLRQELDDADDEGREGLAEMLSEASREVGSSTGVRQPSERIAADLRAALFDPLVDVLDGATRVFLAPDGDLCRLPFEVLPLTDGRCLLDVYELSYLSVGRELLASAPPTAAPGAPVVVGDPDFDAGDTSNTGDRTTRPGWPFRHLEGTRLEAEQVAARLGVTPLTGASARKSDVLSVSSPSILHLATHGAFLPDDDPSASGPAAAASWMGRLGGRRLANPLLRSCLALTAANTWLHGGTPPQGASNGLLTAEDVALMDLQATELVVLSACQTGLGLVRVGEGVLGLRRAFVLAGARTLVMSLWKVPDEPTRALMDQFYARLAAGEPAAAALRGAQRWMKERFPDPLCWGAFVCLGHTGAAPEVTRPGIG